MLAVHNILHPLIATSIFTLWKYVNVYGLSSNDTSNFTIIVLPSGRAIFFTFLIVSGIINNKGFSHPLPKGDNLFNRSP